MAELTLRKKYYTGLQIIDAVKDLHLSYDDSLKLYKNLSETGTANVVEERVGTWTEKYVDDRTTELNPFMRRRFYCSACGEWNTHGKSRYCPKCGAKMDGGTDNG